MICNIIMIEACAHHAKCVKILNLQLVSLPCTTDFYLRRREESCILNCFITNQNSRGDFFLYIFFFRRGKKKVLHQTTKQQVRLQLFVVGSAPDTLRGLHRIKVKKNYIKMRPNNERYKLGMYIRRCLTPEILIYHTYS